MTDIGGAMLYHLHFLFLWLLLAELGEYAFCRFGVQECYLQSLSARAWCLVNGAYLLLLALGKGIGNSVLYLVGNVVYAFATVLY